MSRLRLSRSSTVAAFDMAKLGLLSILKVSDEVNYDTGLHLTSEVVALPHSVNSEAHYQDLFESEYLNANPCMISSIAPNNSSCEHA